MVTKYVVNNLSGQTITGDITINGNLSVTGTSNTIPYKVYTALLTQSGGDDPQTIFSGTLVVGTTYLLVGTYAGDDFSNVGGPEIMVDSEYDGTYFIATGTTPNSWTQGTELQYNTGAPVATVLENTIGNIWFIWDGVGNYSVNSDGLFTSPYAIFISNNTQDSADTTQIVKTNIYDADFSYILTYAIGVSSDDILFNTPIEIRVYN